jgi:shikimate kinase
MQNIFLIGYMGAGKTTIGKQIAKRVDWQFVDMDTFIENRYHKKVSTLFAEKGEETFREIEHSVLREISQFENTVISTGGGAPCFFDNMDWMNRTGITVYLKMSVSELARRLTFGKQERPLIKDKNRGELIQYIADHLEKRETWYNRASLVFPAEQMHTGSEIFAMVENLIKQINEKQT